MEFSMMLSNIQFTSDVPVNRDTLISYQIWWILYRKDVSWNLDRGFNSRAVNCELIPQILKKKTYLQKKTWKKIISATTHYHIAQQAINRLTDWNGCHISNWREIARRQEREEKQRFYKCVVHLWMHTREIFYKWAYTLIKSVDDAQETYTINGYTWSVALGLQATFNCVRYFICMLEKSLILLIYFLNLILYSYLRIS